MIISKINIKYRDAKQFTGLTNCQARSENKLDFHFNAALTAVNLAKQDWLANNCGILKPFSMANYKTMYNNTLILERFMCMFTINLNTAINQKNVKELLDYSKFAAYFLTNYCGVIFLSKLTFFSSLFRLLVVILLAFNYYKI